MSLCAAEKIPAWYFNPPADDEIFWYGVGEGDSIRKAKDEALADIGSKISVTIGSKVTKDATQSTTGTFVVYNQNVNVNLVSEVKKMSFNNFEVVYTAQNESKQLALVKVEKARFLKDQSQILKDTLNEFDRLKLITANKSALEKFQKYQSMLPEYEKSKTILSVLASFDFPFDRIGVSQKIVDFRNSMDEQRSSLEFYINSDTHSQYHSDILKEALSMEKIKILRNLKSKNNNLVILDLDTKTTDKLIYGSYMTNARTTVSLKSKEGVVLSTFTIESRGVSSLDQASALKNASNNFGTQVAEKGVFSFLGIN